MRIPDDRGDAGHEKQVVADLFTELLYVIRLTHTSSKGGEHWERHLYWILQYGLTVNEYASVLFGIQLVSGQAILEVFPERVHSNTLLLPGIAVTHGNSIILKRLMVNCNAERRSDLVLTGI